MSTANNLLARPVEGDELNFAKLRSGYKVATAGA